MVRKREILESRWVVDGHHNDIVTGHEQEYFDRMESFLSFCLDRFD